MSGKRVSKKQWLHAIEVLNQGINEIEGEIFEYDEVELRHIKDDYDRQRVREYREQIAAAEAVIAWIVRRYPTGGQS